MKEIIHHKHNLFEKSLIHISMKFKGINEFLFDIENFFFLKNESEVKGIFITGLARSGTTAALNLLFNTGLYASLKYEDMPFLLCPNLFSKLKKFFKSKDQSFQRAHGDNIKISSQSPEAFEEFFWKKELNDKYIGKNFLEKNEISQISAIKFKKYIQLILKKNDKKIYISKNNNNILRIPFLNKNFPNSKILIFFRNPIYQCSSLLNQHLNFIDLQKKNKFILDYMNYIGHHEFGRNLKRFKLGNYEENNPELINFWIEVWTKYYQYVLDNFNYDNVEFICYEDLIEKKSEYLKTKLRNEFYNNNLDLNFYDNIDYLNKIKKDKNLNSNFNNALKIYEELRSK